MGMSWEEHKKINLGQGYVILWYNEYLVSALGSWHIASKTLEISKRSVFLCSIGMTDAWELLESLKIKIALAISAEGWVDCQWLMM
jgi:hypothetical protein